MKKIALYIHDLNGGGAEGVMLGLANYLVSREYVVDFVLDRAEGALISKLDRRVNIFDLAVADIKKAVFPLRKYLVEQQPSCVISTLKENNLNLLMAKMLTPCLDTRIIIREANTLSEEIKLERSLINRFKHFLIKLLYSKADKIVALSEHMKKDIVKITNVSPDNIVVIFNPVDVDEIVKASSLGNSKFLDEKKKKIVMLSRLTKVKGHFIFIDAIKELIKERNDFYCVVMGSGEDRESIIAYAQKSGVSNYIEYLGFCSNPFVELKDADCFVQASYFEGMPNAVLQAMALERRIVSTNSPGAIKELACLNTEILLSRVGDSQDLYMKIAESLNGRNVSNLGGEVARKYFSKTEIFYQYERIISGVK
ncbi:glycosyltransferase [Aeromonas veronii]|uniref:glycosyltransferase n=1 Tax=Aeromonas veronii TaxID=654 RepID=UPI0031FD2E76